MQIDKDFREVLEPYKWEHPDSYAGYSPIGDYVIYSRNRDSDCLSESNYERIFEDLKRKSLELESDDDEPFVSDFRAGHWACGWVEYIILDQSAPDELLIMAAEIVAGLQDYPCYDESDWIQREWDELNRIWESMSIKERIYYLKDAGQNIFESRHDYFPQDDNGYIRESLLY